LRPEIRQEERMRSALGIALAGIAAWTAAPRAAEARCRPDPADLATQSRSVTGFHEIDLTAPAELIIKQGARESLTVRADRRIMPDLDIAVRDGRLHLDLDRDRSRYDDDCMHDITFEVTVVNLSALDVSGAGTVRIGALSGKRLDLDLGGATNLKIDRLAVGDLRVDVTGAGQVRLAGQASRQVVRISGTGSFRGEGLSGQTASVTISGTGSARVNASKDLDATISGVGQIQYLGNPRIRRSISGMGSLSPINR
jgi:hypothetical protein